MMTPKQQKIVADACKLFRSQVNVLAKAGKDNDTDAVIEALGTLEEMAREMGNTIRHARAIGQA